MMTIIPLIRRFGQHPHVGWGRCLRMPRRLTSGGGFSTRTKFHLRDAEVNEHNVPSAAEVSSAIPTTKELHQQLPSARELEQKYVTGPSSTSAKAPLEPCNDEVGMNGPLDVEEEEILATDPEQARQHVLLAYRALMWGTIYALIGCAITVVVAMMLGGCSSIHEVQERVRDKTRRDVELLRLRAAAESVDGEEVRHFVIDLTQLSTAGQQIREVWRAIQEVAETEGQKADN